MLRDGARLGNRARLCRFSGGKSKTAGLGPAASFRCTAASLRRIGRRLDGGLCAGLCRLARRRTARFGLGQRQRMLGLLVEETDDVGALLVVLEAGKGHGGSRNIAARIGEEFVELIEGPLAAFGLHRSGEVEAAALPAV